ncbi:hypothetical protein [Rubinisphaera margarita]|uniref:hypothetical protein n=1 Tax=Rubinisphaera margarita TaxID=2909586 RepID=UPI001EE7D6C1|nr:hypothetical protein [Rubinisphaera margarita]MCG6154760.1 hypothetical protein [Rubinisphaera margarita]
MSQSMVQRLVCSLALVGIGYFLGTSDILQPSHTAAQPPSTNEDEQNQAIPLANETVQQIQMASEALTQAMETLRLEGRYNPAAVPMNPFLILTGGGDAIEDLEQGNGVDPITFAQLYAGMAMREVGDEISRDEQNRLLYKGRLIRMYSIERMQKRYEMHQRILEKRILP